MPAAGCLVLVVAGHVFSLGGLPPHQGSEGTPTRRERGFQATLRDMDILTITLAVVLAYVIIGNRRERRVIHRQLRELRSEYRAIRESIGQPE